MLYNVVLTFESSIVTSGMKDAEQYFPVVMFIMLYKVVLTFESVDKILKSDYSNERISMLLSCGFVKNASY